MEQELQQVKERRYDTKEKRYKTNNIINLSVLTFMVLIIVGGMLVQLGTDTAGELWTVIVPSVFLVASVITGWIIYAKNHTNPYNVVISDIIFLVGYMSLMLTARNSFVVLHIFPLLVSGFLLYNSRFIVIFSSMFVATSVLRIILSYVIEYGETNNVTMMTCGIAGLTGILFAIIANKAVQYNHDATHSAMDKEKLQTQILNDVFAVSKSVKSGALEVEDLLNTLKQASDSVEYSMGEILESTKVTATSIEDQTSMTQNIQSTIADTVVISGEMMDAATNSRQVISDSMSVVEDMKNQATVLMETNETVTDSMNRLQNKTKEVKEITGIIYGISSQTNLLALNASIESARAGEAGRGFAVVADQIRQLSEETRKSTEQIQALIAELEANSLDTSNKVDNALQATNHQTQLIGKAAQSFETIDRNVNGLTDHMNHMDQMIQSLKQANETIVDNISQLSATSEEVYASAEESSNTAHRNAEITNDVRELFGKVLESIEQIDKYTTKDDSTAEND